MVQAVVVDARPLCTLSSKGRAEVHPNASSARWSLLHEECIQALESMEFPQMLSGEASGT